MKEIMTRARGHRAPVRFVLTATIASAALVGSLLMSVETSEAQAPNAMVQRYGYQFCAILARDVASVHDCSFVTLEQCQATASGQGYCLENSAYIAARANAALAPIGPPRRRAHKTRH